MASRNRNVRSERHASTGRSMYIYGNTVRQAEVMPRRREEQEMPPRRKKKVSRQIQKNRNRALHVNSAYVVFITFAAVVLLAVCVWYLQLRAEITSRAENITSMQRELAEAKEENQARYNAVVDSVNLEEVRDRAMKDLGMVYASSDQIVGYQNPVSDYVKQIQDIPKSGILAQSDKVGK